MRWASCRARVRRLLAPDHSSLSNQEMASTSDFAPDGWRERGPVRRPTASPARTRLARHRQLDVGAAAARAPQDGQPMVPRLADKVQRAFADDVRNIRHCDDRERDATAQLGDQPVPKPSHVTAPARPSRETDPGHPCQPCVASQDTAAHPPRCHRLPGRTGTRGEWQSGCSP